jgi:hypothetical protein
MMRVHMGRLRIAHGVGRLSEGKAREISEELHRRNIGHYPPELPTSQNDVVALYELDQPFAQVAEALESLEFDEHAIDILRRIKIEHQRNLSERPYARQAQAAPGTQLQALTAMIRCLDRAQARRPFVGLKWFRDVELPAQAPDLGAMAASHDQMLREAISRGIIHTYSVPNPNDARRHTTAIALNEESPDVRAALAASSSPPGRTRRRPIAMRPGTQPLSATVLRDRR